MIRTDIDDRIGRVLKFYHDLGSATAEKATNSDNATNARTRADTNLAQARAKSDAELTATDAGTGADADLAATDAGLLAGMDAVYHPQVVFADPAGVIRGRDNLRQHFIRLLTGASRCEFHFDNALQIASADAAALFWRMTLVAPPLAAGREFAVSGASRLQFAADGLVIAHTDFFDLGAMLYEQLPLLGAICRRLRRRLAQQP